MQHPAILSYLLQMDIIFLPLLGLQIMKKTVLRMILKNKLCFNFFGEGNHTFLYKLLPT